MKLWPFGNRAPKASPELGVGQFIHRQQRPPTRDQAGILQSFSKNPRLYSVASRVADGVATPQWRAYKADRSVYRDFRGRDEYERREIKQDLTEVSNSQTLALWNRSSPDLTSHQIRRLIQLSLDLSGDSYSILEPNALGLPGFIYPLNPCWVLPPNGRALINGERNFLINGGGFTSKNYPASQILAIRLPDPNDPYGRGAGVGTSLANEIDVDEYAAQTAAAKFFNGGMPDWFIKLEGLGEKEIQAYQQKFEDDFRGPTKRGKLKFTNAKGLEAVKLDQSIVDMDLVELRRFAAEVIRESFGVPPEILGNVTNSNRATISAAYFLFATLCLVPRLRVIEDAINQCLAPLFGEEEAIFITYDSPVPEDAESEAEMVKSLPKAFTVNEIRSKGGADPIEEGGDDLYTDIDVLEQEPVDSEDDVSKDGEEIDTSAEPVEAVDVNPEGEAVADPNKINPTASPLSLSGIQVEAMSALVDKYAAGKLPKPTVVAMLKASFGLTDAQALEILDPLDDFEPTPDPVAPPPPPAPTPKAKADE